MSPICRYCGSSMDPWSYMQGVRPSCTNQLCSSNETFEQRNARALKQVFVEWEKQKVNENTD